VIDKTAMLRTSRLELQLYEQIEQAGLPQPQYQHPVCGHRADFAWPDRRVCVEVQGGTWAHGRHNRGTGYADDRMLANRRQLAGWTVLEFTADHLNDGSALDVVRDALTKEATWTDN